MYEVHVGRQHILSGRLETHAYELLFQPSASARAADVGELADQATSTVVVNTFLHFGLEQLTGGKLAFLKITRPFVTGRLALPLSPVDVVLELVSDLGDDPEIEAGARRLRDEGFLLALDDFAWEPGRDALLGLAHYVKIDIWERDPGWLTDTVQRLHSRDLWVVADGVDTPADLEVCLAAGFDYLQGNFLLQPKVLTTRAAAPGSSSRMVLLAKLADPDVSFADIESLVASDAALNYRLLRAANSAAAGARHPIESVRSAMVMLGMRRLRSWLFLMSMAEHVESQDVLLASAATRAHMCELLAPRWLGKDDGGAFLVGLLSRLDLLLGLTMDEIVDGLGLEDSLRVALLNRTGPMGELLLAVEAYETYDGQPIPGPFSLDELAVAYLASVAWYSELFRTPAAV